MQRYRQRSVVFRQVCVSERSQNFPQVRQSNMHQGSTHHRPPPLASAITFAILVAACDGLADSHTDAPALASLQGTLSLASGTGAPDRDRLKLGLVWEVAAPVEPEPEGSDNPCAPDPSTLVPDANEWSGYLDPADYIRIFISRPFAEQPVALQSDFPIEFTFDIAEPPPDDALTPIDIYGVSHALGELVVYRDENQNGKLDPSTFEHASPDRLLAASEGIGPWGPAVRLQIEFMTGKPHYTGSTRSTSPREYTDELLAAYRPGYNLVPPGGMTSGERPVPIGTPIALTLEDGPYLRSKLCSQYCQRPADYACPKDPAELAGAPRPNLERDEANAYADWHDDDGTLTGSDECYSRSSGHKFYKYDTFSFNDCIYEAIQCVYRDDKLPAGVSLPCETYPLEPGEEQPFERDAQ